MVGAMRTQMALLVASLVSTLVPRTACAQPAQSTLKLTVLSGRPVIEGVYLNGQGPYRFLLDTGSQKNQVEAGLARKLGLAATFQRDLYTPSGPLHVQGGRVSQVALGSATAENQDFLFTNFDGIHALSPEIRESSGRNFSATSTTPWTSNTTC